MKKVSVLLVSVAIGLQAMAQNSNVTSSKMHMDEFIQHQDSTELYAAKKAIDEAAANDKTRMSLKCICTEARFTLHYLTLVSIVLSPV
jgi:hypothetical protein